MRETWVRSLGQEDPLEKGKAPHSSVLAWLQPCSAPQPEGSTEEGPVSAGQAAGQTLEDRRGHDSGPAVLGHAGEEGGGQGLG